jgi:hypothetical protein
MGMNVSSEESKEADVKRGSAKCCSKSCAASMREKRLDLAPCGTRKIMDDYMLRNGIVYAAELLEMASGNTKAVFHIAM